MKLLHRLVPYRQRALDAEAANDKLIKIMANPMIEGLQLGRGSLTIGTSGGAAGLLAGMLAGMLDEVEPGGPAAENYIELSFRSPKHGPIIVTVQRVHGKTPADFKREAEIERDAALQALAIEKSKGSK